MGKVNCYRRSSAEHEPYDTTEVRHLRPGNSQRAAYVYIAYFSEKMEDKVGGTFDERVGRTQLLSRCVFLRRRSQISSVTGAPLFNCLTQNGDLGGKVEKLTTHL